MTAKSEENISGNNESLNKVIGETIGFLSILNRETQIIFSKKYQIK